ncbi:MAG: YIP1 family protein [Candidatus Jordarchaeaceae archaeon]
MSCPRCGAIVAPDEEVCPECNYRIAQETLERLLPLLRRPEKEPISAMPLPTRIFKAIIAPNQAFHDISRAPDATGPFVLYLLNVIGLTLCYAAGWTHIYPFGNYWALRAMGEGALFGRFLSNAILVLIQFLFLGFIYWLPFQVLERKGSFKKDLSIIGYAYTPVLIGRALSVTLLFTLLPTVIIPANADIIQAGISITLVFSSPIWSAVTVIEVACWLWAAFIISLGIRQSHNLSTTVALVSSYAIMLIFLAIFVSLLA